eukprot:6194699-Pleurochrysis_carterae.AAC.2
MFRNSMLTPILMTIALWMNTIWLRVHNQSHSLTLIAAARQMRQEHSTRLQARSAGLVCAL